MTEQTWLERNGATPGKLAAVGTLAVVLVAVVWHNFAGSEPPAQAPKTRPTTPQAEVAAKQPATTKPAQAKPELTAQVRKVWPKYSLDKVTKHDPLAKPMWYLMAQAAEDGYCGRFAGTVCTSAGRTEETTNQDRGDLRRRSHRHDRRTEFSGG